GHEKEVRENGKLLDEMAELLQSHVPFLKPPAIPVIDDNSMVHEFGFYFLEELPIFFQPGLRYLTRIRFGQYLRRNFSDLVAHIPSPSFHQKIGWVMSFPSFLSIKRKALEAKRQISGNSFGPR